MHLQQDDKQFQIKAVHIINIIFGDHMNIFLIIKVNILFLIEESNKSHPNMLSIEWLKKTFENVVQFICGVRSKIHT